MRRATALVLLLALTGPQAAPLAAAAGSAVPPRSTTPAQPPAHARSAAPTEAEAHHHHPPGCPWQGTPDCPHDHHGPSSQHTWSPCAKVPLAVAGEARMAWAPPEVASREAPAPAPPPGTPSTEAQKAPFGPHPDIEIPPPRTARAA